ncbi:diaminopropionate ammonia-lyase [Seohaeicola saemankumensis]|nr:diaminopropionate ammonia-lyase [Seohaeicola saemankumensis]MCA0872284.1 diaminopropionate ammonia-lyase [Seohaeicola saemankumensis]
MYHANTTQPLTPADIPFRIHADRPLALLRQCPAYAPTPLREVARLTANRLWIKDETTRMRLGSFKALGGAFAVAQMICDRSGLPDPTTAGDVAGAMTFITASAGNHGLSVAAGAQVFGATAKIVLSASVPEAFANRIRAKGADVIRIDGSYEDSVTEAARLAAEHGWIHLADGSWEGYTEAPALVMEGYTVLAEECRQAFENTESFPDHVLLQAGVGGLAAAVAGHIRCFWPKQPRITVVEPDAAPCLLRSVQAGALTHADGPVSNMGRLDCKDASLLAFETLRRAADDFVTVTDAQAAEAAARMTATGIATTPSGGAALAAIPLLDLPAEASIMIIASEGTEGN